MIVYGQFLPALSFVTRPSKEWIPFLNNKIKATRIENHRIILLFLCNYWFLCNPYTFHHCQCNPILRQLYMCVRIMKDGLMSQAIFNQEEVKMKRHPLIIVMLFLSFLFFSCGRGRSSMLSESDFELERELKMLNKPYVKSFKVTMQSEQTLRFKFSRWFENPNPTYLWQDDLMKWQDNYGVVFDCVDIYKQPAFDHPFLKNHILQVTILYFLSLLSKICRNFFCFEKHGTNSWCNQFF